MDKFDEVSGRILRQYLRDSRQSFRKIARETSVSSGTVASRVKEMEERGIIKKYIALLDYEKLGYELTVITEFTVSGGMMMGVGEKLANWGRPSVSTISQEIPILMVVAKFRTRSELNNFTKNPETPQCGKD